MRIMERIDNLPMKMLSKVTFLALTAILATSLTAHAAIVNLGNAAGWSVLTYNSNNTSDSAFNGGPIGVVNGNWTQSGGGQTDTQQPTTVYLSPGFTNNGPKVLTTVYDAAKLNAAWNDAVNASAMLASLAPTQTFGAITSAMTISEATKGNYVFNISSINLNQSALTLSAPQGSQFVLNISGNITLNGGSQGNGILLAGGLTSNDVFINLTGANSNLTTSGGGNAQQIFGTVLATGINASVNLHPGQINGEIIARTLTTSSGALGVVPEINPSPVVLGFLGFVVAFGSRRSLLRRAMAAAGKSTRF